MPQRMPRAPCVAAMRELRPCSPPRAARLLVPCSSITRARGSCSLPPRSPSPPSLSGAGACAPERGRHECRRRARCRCYCLHSIPPPSEPSAASSSPHRAAPLDLLDRRHWPLLLPVVREAAVAAEAPWPAVLGPPQAELWAPSCAYALVGAPRRCQPPPANAGQLLRRRRRSCAPARRARAWPVHLGPPLGHP